MVDDLYAQAVRRRIRRKLNLDPIYAVLGDADGVIYEPGRPGYVRVRKQAADGRFTAPAVVRAGSRAPLRMVAGARVILGYDEDDELTLMHADFAGQETQGQNPALNNPADSAGYKYVSQSAIVTLLSHAVSTPATASTDVAVREWMRYNPTTGTWALCGGERVALTAYIPATEDYHCLAGLFVNSANALVVGTSVAQHVLAPLGLTDVQEATDMAGGAGLHPVWFWRLYQGQTNITDVQYPDGDSFLDGRQFINV